MVHNLNRIPPIFRHSRRFRLSTRHISNARCQSKQTKPHHPKSFHIPTSHSISHHRRRTNHRIILSLSFGRKTRSTFDVRDVLLNRDAANIHRIVSKTTQHEIGCVG